MKVNRITKGILLFCSLITIASAAESREYDHARDAYKRGDYAIARIYFENILIDNENREFFPDAFYYLLSIYNRENDFIQFLTYANRFLRSYDYDSRATDVFALLMRVLLDRKAYRIAYEYVKKYNFLVSDLSAMEELGRNLLEHGEPAMADYVLSYCNQSDAVKIMRAATRSDLSERGTILESLSSDPLRALYLTNNLLLMGDTVSAFMSFRNMSGNEFNGGDLYLFVKIALLFDSDNISHDIKKLGTVSGFDRKADLLYALIGEKPTPLFLPGDDEEKLLFLQIYSLDTISRKPPENIFLDSILADVGDTMMQVRELRKEYRNNYHLDSTYCHLLMKRGDYEQASRVISNYLKYENTGRYVRKTMGFYHFTRGDYRLGARNIILSNDKTATATYLLAECLRFMGQGSADLYTSVMAHTADSVLRRKAVRGYVLESYRAESYDDILSVDFVDLADDTALVRLYSRSLARAGKVGRADSLFHVYFQGFDDELLNLYGEYLISNKQYRRAKAYYDSIIQQAAMDLGEGIYYNWAMGSFLNNEMDSALYRFRHYVSHFRRGGHFHDALFKIATLNYLEENYDSAGHYYGLASDDADLMPDAMQNQLISYKKAGNWALVINTGEKMLNMVAEEKHADLHFEIGYALLRVGRPHEAIENLQIAARAKPEPSYYYWLGEAYLGKGDFSRAFHGYQKIVDRYPDDEMWTPTARYKTGITLELLDELDAAKKVYEQLVRERGINDPIAAEANKRLEFLQR